MTGDTIVMIYRDSVFFSDLKNTLRSVGCCVFRGDERDEDIGLSESLPEIGAVIFDSSSVPDKILDDLLLRLAGANKPVKLIVIGSFDHSRAVELSSHRNVFLFRPPVDLRKIFEALDIRNEPDTEAERQERIIRRAVDSALLSAGFSRQMTGFEPVKESVCYIVSNNCRRMQLSGEVYKHTAVTLNIRPTAVERSVRVAVGEAWEELPERLRKSIFGDEYTDHPPTNRAFLYMFARRISEEIALKTLSENVL